MIARKRLLLLALTPLLGLAPGAWAATPPPPATAPVIDELGRCRKLEDHEARLACYDRATDSLFHAEATGAVVIVDREQVRAVKRQAFGLNLPSLSFMAPKFAKDDTPNQVDFTVTGARRNGEGRWIVTTDGGAVWEAVDADDLYPEPRAGAKLTVRRGAIGSFFCKVTSTPGYKCRRTG